MKSKLQVYDFTRQILFSNPLWKWWRMERNIDCNYTFLKNKKQKQGVFSFNFKFSTVCQVMIQLDSVFIDIL